MSPHLKSEKVSEQNLSKFWLNEMWILYSNQKWFTQLDFNEASNHSCTNKLWITKIYCQESKEMYKKSYETNSKLVNKKGY